MRMMNKILAGGAGLAAIAVAAPSAAQYRYANPYGYSNQQAYGSQYGYGNQYGNQYGYGMNTQVAAQQCSAAVQNRLYNRGGSGIGGILGAVLGGNGGYGGGGRVVSITQVRPGSNGTVRVRGLASSGRYASNNGYGAYGQGAYGALGYGYQADLSFKCDVDYRGYVRNVSINRR